MDPSIETLIAEANALDLFRPHGAFEVHCANCHARLDGMGDCATCGLIGRPQAELERRAQANPEAVKKLLSGAIAKRKAYKPVGGKAER
jgi:hypothetical protein